MASSWLNALENLQSQFVGLPDVEKHFEKDFQWVEEIFAEATTLFKKDTTQEVSENTNEDDTPNGLEVAPVLLPQTPRVCLNVFQEKRAKKVQILSDFVNLLLPKNIF